MSNGRGDYRGFSYDFQLHVGRYQELLFRTGAVARPTTCAACLVFAPGAICSHLEDYNDPVSGLIPMCHTCHMHWHWRSRDLARWATYVSNVRAGLQFPARPWREWSFAELHRSVVPGAMRPVNEARAVTLLDLLAADDQPGIMALVDDLGLRSVLKTPLPSPLPYEAPLQAGTR